MVIPALLLALTMGGVIFRLISRARSAGAPGSLTLHSVRERREIRKAARQFFREGGWTASTESTGAESFSQNLRPAGPEVVLLLLLGVLPGLAYLVAGKRRVTVIVTFDADGDGSETLVSWSNSSDCEQTCRAFASMIRSQEPQFSNSRPDGRTRRQRSVRRDEPKVERRRRRRGS